MLQPVGTEVDKQGLIGVDHVAYTYASLKDLLDKYVLLNAKGIAPYGWIHHGVSVSMYYADPDGSQMKFQVVAFDSSEEANAFRCGPSNAANPTGVESNPEDWLDRMRAGAPPADFLVRRAHQPVSLIRGAMEN